MKNKRILRKSKKQSVNPFPYTYVIAAVILIVLGSIGLVQRYKKNSVTHQSNIVETVIYTPAATFRPSPMVDPIYSLYSQPMIYNTSPDQQSNIYSNYKHYINKQANFSIDYPDFLTRTEYYPVQKEGAGIPPGKRVYFCKKPLDTSNIDFTRGNPLCDGEGILIWYDGMGWGGGCDRENHDTILMMGKASGYCSYQTSFNQLYYGPPRGEENNPKYNQHNFSLTGVYGDSLTKTEVEKMIATFNVTDP